MKKIYCIAILLCLSTATALPNPNILKDAIPDNAAIDSKEAFYNVWQLYDAQGAKVGFDGAPFSCFSQIFGMQNFMYNNKQIQYYGNKLIENGEKVLLLRTEAAYQHYVIPVNINREGTYTLSGVAKNICDGGVGTETFRDNSLMSEYNIVVLVAEEEPGERNFEIVSEDDGTARVKVTDNSGGEYPNIFVNDPCIVQKDDILPFSKQIALTPSIKYISIYCPASKALTLVGNLRLDDNTDTGMVLNTAVQEDAAVKYYNLNGICVSADSLPEAPGLYIMKKGSEVRKIMK